MIRLPKFAYIAPTTIEEACSLLDKQGSDARILAGGTDLLVAAKLRNEEPRYVVSLRHIDELKGITYRGGEGLKIGATTSLYQVRHDRNILEHYRALAQAAAGVGTPQLQRMGTLGGNLCLNTRCYYFNQSSHWRKHRPVCFKMGGNVCHVASKGNKCFAVFSADTPPALMAFDAKVKLVSSRGERVVSVKDLYTGDGKKPIALNPGEILAEIQLPPPPDAKQGSIYLKYRIRAAIDFPLVSVAARIVLDGRRDTCLMARVLLNAVGPAPLAVSEAGTLLEGSTLSDDVITRAAEISVRAAHPVPNVDSTPTYRRKMSGILTRRAIEELSKGLRSW